MENLLNAYNAFTRALTEGDTVTLSQLVDKATFRAILPGGPRQGLEFPVFVAEMERRRAPFSDFGQNVEVHRTVASGNTIAVHYSMTVTHDGELTAWGAGGSLPPTQRQITITSIDMVSFDADNRVVELVVVSDRLPTILQMGGLG